MGISQSAVCRRSGIALLPAEASSGGAACGSMAWGFLLQGRRRLRRRRRRRGGDGGGGDRENKSWLLAEGDSQSVHSSFRLSFGSQAEEEMEAPPTAEATVLILVSTDDEGEAAAGRRRELNGASADLRQLWRRLDSLERSIAPAAGGLVRFSYAQLRSATHDFCRGKELGRGALSRVYKGRFGHMMQRRVVAIKRVDGPERESAKAFCRELLIASSLCSSPNVVPLVGYCIDGEGLFLVYTYISGGSLDRRLHQNEKRGKVLPWKVRYKVAVGVARAMEYLHFGTNKCVVHRDIKPSNILLSSKRSPMLCDFGLATWTLGPSLPFLCKSVKGTFGYLAPEYFQNGKLSDKTDVYAFGVVLLELITGRKALDQSRPQGDENLVMWAKPLLLQGEDVMEKLIDPRLATDSYRWNGMCRMVRAASACLRCEDSMRPSIDQVLAMLLGEENPCTDWSLFNAHGCIVGYGGSQVKRDMGGHLALAMLGVSDNEEGDSYGR